MTFEEVVTKEQGMLKAYVGSFGVRSGEVDDLTQRSFILLYEKWDSLNENSNYGAYLRTLAKGLVRNEISKQANRRSLIDKNITSLILEQDDLSPIDLIIENESSDASKLQLHACILKLQDNMSRILKARYWDGKNSTEIADQEGKSPSAIRKLLMKIKVTLRLCMTSNN